MPGFAKFLVFMNFVAACGFLYLATIDYNARRPWAYEMFLGELAVDGLPLDDRDPGPRRVDIALFQDLDDTTLKQLFVNAGSNPPKGGKLIHTQQEEVAFQKAKTNKELDDIKDDEDKRAAIRSLVLPLTLTLEERDYWVKRFADKDVDVEELVDDLNKEFFDKALKKENYSEQTNQYEVEEGNPDRSDILNRERADLMKQLRQKYPDKYIRMTRRQHASHLLYNLSRDAEAHTRVMVVIGLKAYIAEAESQAARLREMSLRTRMAMVDERSLFEVEYQRLLQRIYLLFEELEAKQLFKKDKEAMKERTAELVKVREKDRDELLGQVGKARTELDTALSHQEWWEEQIFNTQKKLGELQGQAENLQRYIRRLEGAGYR